MLNIRPATVNDAPAIAHISIDTWRSAYAGIVPTDFLDTLSYAERSEQMRQHLASFSAEDGFLLVAEDAQGEGIGFASGGEYGADQPGCGEIYTLYYYPTARGKALGDDCWSRVRNDSGKQATTGYKSGRLPPIRRADFMNGLAAWSCSSA
jgi:L-amino acid N-acyltransferase YncA